MKLFRITANNFEPCYVVAQDWGSAVESWQCSISDDEAEPADEQPRCVELFGDEDSQTLVLP